MDSTARKLVFAGSIVLSLWIAAEWVEERLPVTHLALAVAAFLLCYAWRPQRIGGALGAALAAAVLFHYVGVIRESRDLGDGETLAVWSRRWDGAPYYEQLTKWTDEEQWFAEGGVSPSGKRQGRWKIVRFTPEYDRAELWYWYGDPVTEGEFHSRSR